MGKQTTQWPKKGTNGQNNLSTKHTHKPKDQVTRIQLKSGVELRCSEG